MATFQKMAYIKWFDDIYIEDISLVGGKNASLGELYSALRPKGVHIPNGFAVTTKAFDEFLTSHNLEKTIEALLGDIKPEDTVSLQTQGKKIRGLIQGAALPMALEAEILKAYGALVIDNHNRDDVAVRSSATAEDLPDASFAGQQETFLNIQGDKDLLDACKKCFASLYTDRAISYRLHQGFHGVPISLSLCIQTMVRSDLAASGVMFSVDTETGFQEAVLINAAYGLGENVVQGSVTPDEYYVFKPTLKTGHKPILQKVLGSKEHRLIYEGDGKKGVKNKQVLKKDQNSFALSDEDILQLAKWAIEIEEYYSKKKKCFTPMDIEWAKDGRTGELFIVQARPETVQSQKDFKSLEKFKFEGPTPQPLLTGRSVGNQIAQGKVRLVKSTIDLSQFKDGDILVTEKTDPDWEPVMKKASAIVTDSGGRTCHAAIVSRELGLPAVVGTKNASKILETGQDITVSCAQGEEGFVFQGKLPFQKDLIELESIPQTKTKLMLNLSKPSEAFRLSFYPNEGVGLARLEFIINNIIKIHPLALLHFDDIKDAETRKKINELTKGYDDKSLYFVDKLAEGIAMIAAAFYPKDVIVRLSDFKTDEYADLIGGRPFEPKEDNPMIGFRGASRYYDVRYRDAFALECRAFKKAREDMGLTNIKMMIPFCRTLEEAHLVFQEMEKNGLKRHKADLEVYMMCEVPSNVILADEFAELFDGFSIGSNDLTQLTLGIDRNSALLSNLFDERNQAVERSIASVIKTVKAKGGKIGICGQGPSDYPDFAQFLVKNRIDSISLTPDSILKTLFIVKEAEENYF
ncbi:MAG TPA: phosphoenolpyruvate synthase [Holosporales bacterium]|nr:phosphoenolpyruvate synthase [Holosporales bacterium]